MIDNALIGSKTEPIMITLTTDDIRLFSEAISASNRIYFDHDYAKKEGYETVVAPITMAIIFWQKIKIPWLDDGSHFIHGEQFFLANKPLYANKNYSCSIQLTKIEVKKGMQLLDHVLTVENNKEVILTSTSTLIQKIC